MNYSFKPKALFVNGIPQFPNDENPLAIALYRFWADNHDRLTLNDSRDIAIQTAVDLDLPPSLGEHLFWHQMAAVIEKKIPRSIASTYRNLMNTWLEWIVEEFTPAISPDEDFHKVTTVLMQQIDKRLPVK